MLQLRQSYGAKRHDSRRPSRRLILVDRVGLPPRRLGRTRREPDSRGSLRRKPRPPRDGRRRATGKIVESRRAADAVPAVSPRRWCEYRSGESDSVPDSRAAGSPFCQLPSCNRHRDRLYFSPIGCRFGKGIVIPAAAPGESSLLYERSIPSWRTHGLHKGFHLLIDCRGVPRDVCLDDAGMLDALAESARAAGATVISQTRYHFGHTSAAGFTAIVLLDESHCSAHAYADEGLLALDIFTCGATSPHEILQNLRARLDLGEISVMEASRFRLDEMPESVPSAVLESPTS
ncbi:MAG: hypothetical protein DWQ35_17910 [Planctomycetota bacterium]|nr:MAG: hypothetical protein DWQ35_17910 [Planctomycetota bacterium]